MYSLDMSTCSAAYGAAQRVCRHAWTDPLWDRLSAYERAADNISPNPMRADDTAALQAAAAHILELLAHAVAVRCMSMDHRCEAGTASGSRSAELLEGPYPETVGARAGGDSAIWRSRGDSRQAGGDDDLGCGQAGLGWGESRWRQHMRPDRQRLCSLRIQGKQQTSGQE